MEEMPTYNLGNNPEKKKTVVENSVIEKSEIPGNIEIKGKVIIDGKEVDENSTEAKNAKELLNQWKKTKEGNSDDQTESPRREVKIPSVKELINKGIDEKTAQRMIREQLESEQDFQEAMSGIEILKQMKKAKTEMSEGCQCKKCDSPTRSGDKFCSTCGDKLENEKLKNCPRCGNQMPPTAKFCGKCGTKL